MIGIVGGKPNASMYFVGMQDDYVFYLDPHMVQPFVDTGKKDFDTSSYRTMYPQKMLCKGERKRKGRKTLMFFFYL